jgi:drug/metabolite transporter (DMT)-like permease
VPLLEGASVQFSAAALISSAAAFALETPRLHWTETAIAAVAWNTAVVSLGGMVLYFYLLKHGTAARASANFYLIPGVTAVLAWLFLGEALTPLAIGGLIAASVGCWLVGAVAPAGKRTI